MSFGAYKLNLSKPEFNKEYDRIQAKLDSGHKLTDEEKRFMSSALPFDRLLLYPFCLDEFFSRMYLNITMQPILQKHIDYYKGILNDWKKTVDIKAHEDELLHFISKETREELKVLRKTYPSFFLTSSTKDYYTKRNKIFEWLKYKYLTIKYIFEETIKGSEYKLFLNAKEIVYNYYSLSHILTQHYGQIMKPYAIDKNYFTDIEFDPEILHLKLQDIFQKIDASGFYVNDSVEEINFRYKGQIYKIFCKDEIPLKEKGKKYSTQFLRLNSFFPVGNKKMLARLSTQFEEKVVDDKLSVFVKNGC